MDATIATITVDHAAKGSVTLRVEFVGRATEYHTLWEGDQLTITAPMDLERAKVTPKISCPPCKP